jgi:hypothetical protein
MPLAVDNLTPDSTPDQITKSISESMQQCMSEGKGDQKQCAGMAYGIAREKTGKDLNYGK